MGYKEYLTLSNFFIFICGIIIIILALFIGQNIVGAYNNATLTSDTKVTISSTCASLIVALISVISIVLNTSLTKESIDQTNGNIKENRKHNQETINQTNELIKQNEENRYIQLRFEKAQKSLINLSNELKIALEIQYELSKLNSEKLLFNSRGFLLMQYVNLIRNNDLLDYIPLKLRVDFDSYFKGRLNQPISDESEEYVRDIMSYDEFNYGDLVQEELMYNIEFEIIVNQFIKNCLSGFFKKEFSLYYSSDITEEELVNHMKDIVQEIEVNKPEKHILEEKELIILKA